MQSGLLLTPTVQGGLCTGFALGWLFHSVRACLHSHERRRLQQKVMRFAVGLTHVGTSSHGLTPASHSLPPPPAQLPESTSTPTRDLPGAEGCSGCRVLHSGCSLRHKSCKALCFALYQEADLHHLFRSVLANHDTGNPEGSQNLKICLRFQAMELQLPTYSQVSQSLVSPGVSYTSFPMGLPPVPRPTLTI